MQMVNAAASGSARLRAGAPARRASTCGCRATVALATLLLVACHTPHEDGVQIADARAGATPPGATVAAAYMTIATDHADTLVSATTPAAEKVEMHETTQEAGMARMRPLHSVDIPAGGVFRFEPGGAHFMLVGLREPLATGATVPLTLHFRQAGDRPVTLEVVAPGAAAAH